MHRREFVATMGTAAAVLSTAQVYVIQANAAPAESMHPAKYKALEDSTSHCVSTGDACMRHCLGMLSMKDTSMAGCTNAAYQMMAACGALRTLAAVNSPYVPALAKVIAQVCADCQKECENSRMWLNARRAATPARPAPRNVARLGPKAAPNLRAALRRVVFAIAAKAARVGAPLMPSMTLELCFPGSPTRGARRSDAKPHDRGPINCSVGIEAKFPQA